jgi:acyl-[acyl-carrier-protein]-phospholipid O-acyltransferase/long-chain-fatty-acid--[acyl-carrier-protein] ligase
VPDDKKGSGCGDYAKEATDAETLHKLMSESSLPNCGKGREAYIAVDDLACAGHRQTGFEGVEGYRQVGGLGLELGELFVC